MTRGVTKIYGLGTNINRYGFVHIMGAIPVPVATVNPLSAEAYKYALIELPSHALRI